MKCGKLIIYIVLGILTCMPSTAFAGKKDSLILYRIHDYHINHIKKIDSIRDNVYFKVRYNIERRNPIMKFIPSAHVFYHSDNVRDYLRESYSNVLFTKGHRFDVKQQVVSTNIRGNSHGIYTLLDHLTPNLYEATIYNNHILSPLNKYNKRYYRYKQKTDGKGNIRLDFRPKTFNTQLISGYSIIQPDGRILRTVFNGEFDMISFRTEILQTKNDSLSFMPSICNTAATFRFLGNRISALINTDFDNKKNLPDSVISVTSREMMDTLRPIPLSEADKKIYANYDEKIKAIEEEAKKDTMPKKESLLKKILWDAIGENIFTPIGAESENASFRMSPLIDPLHLSWSDRRGFRYKINLRSMYKFNEHRYLTFEPLFGYNFKFKEFYFTLPLRMTYNPKRNGFAEIIYGNGNRISNNTVAEAMNIEDSLDLGDKSIDLFTDNYLRVFNNVMAFDWLDIESGFIYHRRTAIYPEEMQKYGLETEYRSFALMLGVKINLWRKGPWLSIDWERGLKGINKSSIDYESFEVDTQWKLPLTGLRLVNLRTGAGVYTRKYQNYFIDYNNFRDNNLPEGFEDDWSGNFELLRSRLYQSKYYLRFNVAYDQPMMVACWVPYLGKYIERERFYLGCAIVERTKPHIELGYSFTNRYISIGMFAGFKNTRFQEIGFDFSYEIFRRW